MATKIFVGNRPVFGPYIPSAIIDNSSALGYIGGDALYEIAKAHPEFNYSCLVRNSEKGAQVAVQLPKAQLVYGELDDATTLEEQAKSADIVLNCASSDNVGAVNALIKGLTSEDRNGRPGFLIHTSGSGILLYKDVERKTFGESATEIYDDWEGIRTVTSIPDYAPHRAVDKVIMEAESANLKTAIVCPPTIYGVGRGPGNQRGHQLYELARCTLERKQGFQVGAGQTRWPNVHVFDMSKCYLGLVDAAIQGGGQATWGKDGYYFTENGEHVWGQVSKEVATAAYKQGLINKDDLVTISAEEANKISKWGSYLWGANSRCRAIRARKILEWSPKERSLEKEIPDAVASEARKLGLTTGHAVKVAE